MKLTFGRFMATLLLASQILPHGLPLLCDQVQRGTPADCEQMPARPSYPGLDEATQSTPCINAALCAATATAVAALNVPVVGSTGASQVVTFGTPSFAPAEPQPPLPPPPLA